ncbi:MAG: AI-2E family transporter [Lachnospiraceae bacterium]|nr:AI-2E family transporter [Lachnospiraceae bacterium]
MWNAIPKKYKKLLGIGIIVATVYLGFRYLLPLFFPFLLAGVIARCLRRPVGFLWRKLRVKPAISGAILIVVFLGAVGGGIVYLGKLLLTQFAMMVENHENYRNEWQGYLEGFCRYCDNVLRMKQGRAFSLLSDGLDGILLFLREELLSFVTKHSLKAAVSVTELVVNIIIIFVTTLLLLSENVKGQKDTSQMGGWRQEWCVVKAELSGAGTAYIKTQVILIGVVSLTCALGLLILKNPYALLIGVLIGVFDAFPLLGSVMILVPWAVISFVRGKVFAGAVLLTLYGLCQFFREYLEPKLLGGRMGISPVYSLMAVSIGYELFGIPGLFLGPFGLVLIRSLYKVILGASE